jgi:DNA (cytosine-5)-methyltransferase 1
VAEVDPFASAVLNHRFPGVANLGDITAEDFCDRAINHGPIDVLIGGTPCQSFSIAGRRAGMSDDRGQLTLRFVEILDRLEPEWFVWENVPGVLSSGGGRDFGTLLGALAELGYHMSYRVLDAQYFGVAQRRKRVFLVGRLGRGGAEQVLSLLDGLQGHPAPSRETGQDVAKPLASRTGGFRQDLDNDTYVIDQQQITSKACGTQPTENHAPPLTQQGSHLVWPEVAMPCMSRDYKGPASFRDGGLQATVADPQERIRRLTPRECERLQGFPDDWTLIPWTHGKPAADTPRYKAIGNSMAVPVVEWIGRRIDAVSMR